MLERQSFSTYRGKERKKRKKLRRKVKGRNKELLFVFFCFFYGSKIFKFKERNKMQMWRRGAGKKSCLGLDVKEKKGGNVCNKNIKETKKINRKQVSIQI